ncbi:MAG: RNA polymerase factor sigma-54 [Candidatus Neomarinimicrobiota bacterium]
MPQLRQVHQLKQTLSPQQVLQASLLQLNIINLEQKVIDELELNPLLEQTDSESDMAEKDELSEREVDFDEDPDEFEPANIYDHGKKITEIPIPDKKGFIEGLIQQLDIYDLEEWERRVSEEIIWNLDENGYLDVEIIFIADRFERTEQEIETVLKKVQSLEPAGIAARNLRECLLIQLKDKKSTAYKILDKFFDDYANHRYENIQRELKISKNDFSQATEQIIHLNPRPGEGVLASQSDTVVPDLLAVKKQNKWVVIVNDLYMPDLKISNEYLDLMNQPGLQKSTIKYLKEKYDSAAWFIQAIEQRRQTLTNVMNSIIKRQPDFFAGNLRALRPMKLQDIADEINMDVSTISRSTRGKYVDTIYGIFELKSFFTEGYLLDSGEEVSTQKIKDKLKQLIDREHKDHPLTDTQLAEELKSNDFPVARRTVAKYREQLKLPVARLRRQLV